MSTHPQSSVFRTDAQLPIDSAVLQQASAWMARLWSGQATDADRLACAAWRSAHPEHDRAWSALTGFDQALDDKLGANNAPVSRQVLLEPALQQLRTRRRVLSSLVLGFSVAGLVYYGRQSDAWQLARAEHSTATGEIRTMTLADGTQLVLASASAVDVDYSATERHIVLRVGEVMVTTAADTYTPARPLSVLTEHGSIRALGTRFSVQRLAQASDVQVFEGAVHIKPLDAPMAVVRIDAGEAARFDRLAVQAPYKLAASAESWTQGMLVAEGMRLDAFVAELARYRTGVLRCDPSIASLRVSGVFPLRDTDRALNNLSLGLPVTISRRSSYWVSVLPH